MTFGGAAGFTYSPQCLRVRAGAMVTFSRTSGHPGAVDARVDGSPITAVNTGMSTTVTFATPGFYPYFCQFHGNNDSGGMSGVVQVIP
ncbi:MAG: plastocyanin/azurin family copper-binding protein [Polyangiales bacterium]